MTGTVDPAELLYIDVEELAWTGALVAVGRLERLQPRQPAQTDPRQDPRHRRERHPEHLGDLRRSHPQTPQRRDQADALLASAVRDHGGR